MKNYIITFLCGTMLALGCQVPPADAPTLTDEDKAAIDSTIEAAEAAWNEGGAAAYVNSMYTEDAVFMPPNEPAKDGIENVIEYLSTFPDVMVSFESVEIEGIGSLAYNYGMYTLTTADEAGNTVEIDKGKFVEIWEKQEDGSWKVSKDIYNSDWPVPDTDEMDHEGMDHEGMDDE